MASRNMRATFSNLPRELTLIILSKLRYKAILRSKAVCKEWHDIVTSDPNFAKTHYENNTIALVYRYKEKKERGLPYKLDPYNFDSVVPFDGSSWNEFDVVNSCKGFLLMEKRRNDSETGIYGVYNPLTNETVIVPDCESVKPTEILFLPNLKILKSPNRYWSDYKIYSGLGFSPVTKLFKVVRFARADNPHTSNLQIYTLSNSTASAWRTVSIPKGQSHILRNAINKPIELNGVLHWKGITGNRIVCFDVEKEKFGEMSIIPPIRESGKYLSSVGVYGGLLCLGITTNGNPRVVYMWVMKEYGIYDSWTLLVVIKEALPMSSIGGPPVPNFVIQSPYLVDILDTGEIIFVSLDDWWLTPYHLHSYDPHPIKECFEKFPYPKDYSDMIINLYTPSFFSLKQLQE